MKIIIIIINIILLISIQISAQSNPDRLKELRTSITDKKIETNNLEDVKISESGKSPGISLILSLLVPGAGHLYAGRMDVGKYFLAAESALWLGFAGVNIYGDVLRDDSRTFAVVHSGLNKEGKDKDYFADVGSYDNIYEYNNYRLSRGEYEKIYNLNTHFWDWDLQQNRENFDEQRKKSERMYNATRIFTTGMIINRLASAVSAFLLTKADNSVKISSEFTGIKSGKIDGFKVKFIKTF